MRVKYQVLDSTKILTFLGAKLNDCFPYYGKKGN